MQRKKKQPAHEKSQIRVSEEAVHRLDRKNKQKKGKEKKNASQSYGDKDARFAWTSYAAALLQPLSQARTQMRRSIYNCRLYMATRTPAALRSFSTAAEPPVLVTQKNRLLILELNRPKALNALSLEMCEQIKTLLRERINKPNPDIGAFVMKGAGGKAFCAGGDVKAIWQELQNAGKETPESGNSLPLAVVGSGKPGFAHTDFFRQEYIMNYLLGTSLAPQVSFWDGIVMGGGVGVSVLGEFRVATGKSLFAMPETAIGLFPDVGSSAWLPHLPEGYGEFIGTTLPLSPPTQPPQSLHLFIECAHACYARRGEGGVSLEHSVVLF